MGFILLRAHGVDDLSVGQWQKSASLAESDHHVGLSYEVVEAFHEILSDEVGPSLLVIRVLHDGAEHFIADGMHMFEDVLGDFQEDDVVLEALLFDFFAADTQNDEA